MFRSAIQFVLAVLWVGAIPGAASAAPCVAITVTATPKDRAALLGDMKGPQASLLQNWRSKGLIANYDVLFTRAPDAGVWDAMVMIAFRDDAAQTRWRAQLAPGSGGLAAQALADAAAVETTPCESVRSQGADSAPNPAILVIPYIALIPPADYLAYLDGYTIPQFRGWMTEGVLDGYDIVTSRFPAGRAWNATIVLRYRDDAALARRDEIVAKVRKQLASNPSWKAFSDSKKATRTEGRLALAEEIASGR
ncbi:MAG: hypothetical protein JSR79_14380 [Proteobacteria bacterium]|nr:hypothetical protein [Pseudomonadota bacterium]